MVEERARGKVRNLQVNRCILFNLNMLVQGIHSSLIIQAMQHVNIATVATDQIGQYARSTTTTSVMKRFLDDKQRPGKHVSNALLNFFVSGVCLKTWLLTK